MYNLLSETRSLWQYLKNVKKPIYIYGMGDGALKIISVLERLDVPIAGVYASNGFVRGHHFYGNKVLTFDEVSAQASDFITLLAFAAFREPLLNAIYDMQSSCEFYAPDVPVCKVDDDLFDIDYIKKHNDKLTAVYNMLEDKQSKKVFINTLNFKVSGKINYLKMITTPVDEVFTEFIKPNKDDYYIDLGAYNGDTISQALTYCGEDFAGITAFEPDVKNFKRLKKRIEAEAINNVKAYNLAAWSDNATLLFTGKGGRNSKLSSNGLCEIKANSVDNILKGKKATIIKFDVEGAEEQAIIGCTNTIKKYSPRLLVSSYHKNSDLFTLPMLIKEINPSYKVYLRHHPYIPAWETNYYFINK